MQRPKKTGGAVDWQNEAWYFYDTIGEFRFGVNWKAQAMSRCRLIIETLTDEGTWAPETDQNCAEWQVLRSLFGGDAGQSQAMAAFELHLEVPGESYLVGETVDAAGNPDPNGDDRWSVYSNEELKPKGSSDGLWELDLGDGRKRTLTDESAWIIRLWRPHPRKRVEADSPARAALPILRELEQLTKKIAAEIDSRLAGAGVLFVPTEMTFSGAAGVGRQGQVNTAGEEDPEALPEVTQDDADKFLQDLMEAMVTPIANRDHPSSLVPVVVKAPAAFLDKVKHLSFATPLDERALETRQESIRRVALTANMPADIMLGLGDVNHWTAWQLDESAIKMHVEPDGEVITSALNAEWLPVAVQAYGATPDPRRRIGLDTSDLRLRPDRTAQAQWLYDHLELDGESLRRELGVEGDAPDPQELQEALLRRIAAGGNATPEVVVWAITALFGNGDPGPIPLPGVAPDEETGPRAIAAPEEGPETGPPAEDGPPTPEAPPVAAAGNAAEAAVIATAELLVERAVERAHNRARQRGKHRGARTPEQLTDDLRGAWDSAPRAAERLGLDPDWFVERLDRYARGLLTSGAEHSDTVLKRVLGS